MKNKKLNLPHIFLKTPDICNELFGFGGLHITENGIEQKGEILPKEWKSLTITGVGPEGKTYVVKVDLILKNKKSRKHCLPGFYFNLLQILFSFLKQNLTLWF